MSVLSWDYWAWDELPKKRAQLVLTFRSSFRTVRLHGDVCIQMVECTIRLFATIPPTLVHALNLFVSTAGSLVLLGTRNRNERINLASALVESWKAAQAKIT